MAANNTTATDQLAARIDQLAYNMDDMFLIINAILVTLMQAGFACLEAGCVNSKNVTNIIMKNLLDMFICAICFWLVGYSLAYSPGTVLVGLSFWTDAGLAPVRTAHWFFQFVFAATAATIISGAVAERCNFVAYIVYSSVVSGIVYPVVAHWAWAEGGLLLTMGYRDLAGSGVVHLTAGVCSFVAAAFIGPRIGRFQDGEPVVKPGHSVPLFGIGGLLLITGFLAFNGGSVGHISAAGDGAAVARTIASTILGGSGAAVMVLVLCKSGLVGPPAWAFSTTLNAVLAGMVSNCAGADVMAPMGAIASGAVACIIYLSIRSFVLFLKVDDPLDAVAVHLGGGLWGVLAMAVFTEQGVIYGVTADSLALLKHNVLGIVLIALWSSVCSVLLFGGLRISGYLRVSEDDELEGLDISKHKEPAYPVEGWHLTHPLHLQTQTYTKIICAICFWLVGYSLAYSPGTVLVGLSFWTDAGLAPVRTAHWFFQFVFAATAATIISGAVAERCNFVAYIVYSSVVSGIVYPVVAHWAWAEGGLLLTMGYRDLAGSGVVHLTAGVCSFVAAAFIGPRIGRFQDGEPVEKPGHSVPLFGIGGLLLITGFLAFNGGSVGHISAAGDGAAVARTIASTILGGSGAAVMVLVLCKSGLVGPPAWAFSTTLNAVLAGMVSNCAGADVMAPMGAIASGAVACIIYLSIRSFVLFLKVDDPLDAVAVHLGGGLWGVLAMAVFTEQGVIYGVTADSLALLKHNVLGIVLIALWSSVCSVLLFGGLRISGYLRVSEDDELEGLDISKHKEPAYPVEGWHLTHPLHLQTQTYTKSNSYTLEHGARPLAFDNMGLELENRQRHR